MHFGEALRFSVQALSANPVRSFLTCLGMLIGNASVILVVTISQTSQDYILEQIRGLGSNIIYAYFETGSQGQSKSQADFINQSDVSAVRAELSHRILAATGVMSNTDRILINGREQDVKVIGSDQYYKSVRNLVLLAGRFLDTSDVDMRTRVALLTEKLALRLYGSQSGALGQTLKVYGLPFTVIGTFKERVESFGQTEVTKESVLIPITVLRYFSEIERIDPLYVQAKSPQDVEAVTRVVRQIVAQRVATISGGRTLRTWNDLLSSYPGVFGVKTGHTSAAGWSEVAAARRGGISIYATLLGSPDRSTRNQDLAELLDWAFSRYIHIRPLQDTILNHTIQDVC